MKIAIIGAGLSGLATAYYLLQSKPHEITIYDSKGLGGGASGIAAGLLYAYGGLHAKLNRLGREGMQETLHLVHLIEQELGQPIAHRKGLLRQAFNEENIYDYTRTAKQHPETFWLSAEECQQKIPHLPYQPGLFIPDCYTIDVKAYLTGLYKLCHKQGVQLVQTLITSLDQLEAYDMVIIAPGAQFTHFPEIKIPLTPLKGQMIKVEWPEGIPPLPMSLSSLAYILMNPQDQTAIIGATFERHFISEEIDETFALQDLMPKAIAMFPPIAKAKVLSYQVGIRASAPDYMPLIQNISPRCWVLTGMGSKGLLYHALYGKKLAGLIS